MTTAEEIVREAKVMPQGMSVDQELVILLEGPRGSGKSLGGSYFTFDALRHGMGAYANLPVSANWSDIGHLEAKSINTPDLYTFGEQLDIPPNSVVFLDEFDKLCMARRSSSNANLLLNWLGTQLRKFGLTFVLTAQDMMWIDPMWRFQVDILIKCKDIFFTSFGKRKHIGKGKVILMDLCDLSGVVTGNQYRFHGMPYRSLTLNGEAMWGAFDSYKVMGVQEMLRRFDLGRETYRVGYDDKGTAGLGMPDTSGMPIQNPRGEYVSGVLHDLANNGHRLVLATSLLDLVNQQGLDMGSRELGLHISKLGLKKERTNRGTQYYIDGSNFSLRADEDES